GEEMTRERVLLEHLLHQDREAVEALPHVGATERQMQGSAIPAQTANSWLKTGSGQTSRGPRLGCGRLTCSGLSFSPAPHPRSGAKIPLFPLTTSRVQARIGLPSPTAYPCPPSWEACPRSRS